MTDRQSHSEQSFAHVAAEHGQKEVLQFFQEIVPETLNAADGIGQLPAHLAAHNGHEGVLQFLHQVVPETWSQERPSGEIGSLLRGHFQRPKFSRWFPKP